MGSSFNCSKRDLFEKYSENSFTLLNAGADANIQDDRGQSALMMATSAGYVDVVTQLLNHGAQRELKDNSGKSAIDFASEGKNKELILVLMTTI